MANRGVSAFSAAALRRLRITASLSQDDLAAMARTRGARVAGTHICLYEQGRRKPQLPTAQALADSRSLRRAALLHKVPYYTTIAEAAAVSLGIEAYRAGSLEVRPLQSYFATAA